MKRSTIYILSAMALEMLLIVIFINWLFTSLYRDYSLLCYFYHKCHFRFWLFSLALLRSSQRYMGSPFHVCVLSKPLYHTDRLYIRSYPVWSKRRFVKYWLLLISFLFLMTFFDLVAPYKAAKALLIIVIATRVPFSIPQGYDLLQPITYHLFNSSSSFCR